MHCRVMFASHIQLDPVVERIVCAVSLHALQLNELFDSAGRDASSSGKQPQSERISWWGTVLMGTIMYHAGIVMHRTATTAT
jgi:hypothetical protein